MHKFSWFSSRIKIYNKLVGQIDILDQNFFTEIIKENFGKLTIDNSSKNTEKEIKSNLVSFLNLEWNCNQKIQKSIKITLRKDNFIFFIENCVNFLIVNHNFQQKKRTNFFLFNLNKSNEWINFSNHAVLSNVDLFKKNQEKYILLYIHEKNINYLSSLTINWFPKIL